MKSGQNQKGFSLVELMVSVAIVGLFAAIAIPNVQKYLAKSKRAEARSNLAALFTAEKSFAAEFQFFHSAFQAVGFAPEGRVRYNIGFGAAGVVAGPANGYVQPAGVDVTMISSATYCGAAGIMVNNCVVLPMPSGGPLPAIAAASAPNGKVFTAEALTELVPGIPDIWQITQDKLLNHTFDGL